jgi:hypothetical protein
MSRSYLHPSQRPLKTEQIGPSSHKNEYHVGVLHGNWAEERQAFGRHANGPVRFEGRATTKGAYPPRSGADIKAAQGAQTSNTYEAPRQLLFGHGRDQVNLLTTAELSYPDHSRGESTTSPVKLPDIVGVSKRSTLVQKKQAEWAEWAGDSYVTTKNATFDSTADAVKAADPADVYPRHTSTHHGEFLRSLGKSMHKTGLREQ